MYKAAHLCSGLRVAARLIGKECEQVFHLAEQFHAANEEQRQAWS